MTEPLDLAAAGRIGGPLRIALGNPSIARAVFAYGGWTVADWANWIAILVYAFELGGPGAAGVLSVAILIPAGIIGPVVTAAGDRMARERVLLGSYVGQAATMTALAVAMSAGAPAAVIGVLASAMVVAISVGRPAHHALLPSLSRSPEELTAANVASGWIQNVAILVAPTTAGLVIAAAGPGAVFVITGSIAAASAVLIAGIRTERSPVAAAPLHGGASDAVGGPAAIVGALRALGGHASARTIVLLIATGSVIEGALDVVSLVLALDLLRLGEGGVGLFSSAAGAGGLAGAAAAASLVGRSRLGRAFLGGLVLWSVPVAIVGAAPQPALSIGLFAAAGFGRSIMDVAGRSMLQRVAPEAALSGIFGALEGLHVLMLAVGSLLVPLLIGVFGAQVALIATGLWVPVLAFAAIPAVRRADDQAVVHVRELRRLRAIPMFAPLAPPTIERLAANLVGVTAAAGQWLVREGETGDRYFLIDDGAAEVSIAGRRVRRLGPGEGFGEISLLRDVPRTAGVRAATDVALLALDRPVFLAALSGATAARSTADALVEDRLAADRGPTGTE